ncbi:hypothetical protein R1sor_001317 [Riccia sorocarpa]|uniref:ACT domain-containing protein n=1 Tax=Riccia sorocarpa TaxID=122646 RepID=A0ABD3GVM3_9MARC
MATVAASANVGKFIVGPVGSNRREWRVVTSARVLSIPVSTLGEENERGLHRIQTPIPAASFTPQFSSLWKQQRGGTTVSCTVTVASIVQDESEKEKEKSPQVPLPVVHIDQESDPEATVVEISFGDRLGALLDTIKALKNIGLSVVRAKVTTEGAMGKNRFHITRLDNGSKVEDPELLESIRLTVINNLLKYHPESSEQLALGAIFGNTPPKAALDVDVATHIHCEKVNERQSLLVVETADRPGLLLEIINVMVDISITVESAEIDTEGLVAKDKFYVSYGGSALSKSLEQVLVNCLTYYIRRPDEYVLFTCSIAMSWVPSPSRILMFVNRFGIYLLDS